MKLTLAKPLAPIVVPDRPPPTGYQRPPRDLATYVPDHVATLLD